METTQPGKYEKPEIEIIELETKTIATSLKTKKEGHNGVAAYSRRKEFWEE